ncbi:MAG: selenocysteine-specific translation elongation factor [Anaerolineae bacterium]|nr:selenocysteine-specific translation elongation factor [Anaerolineae bacterium]
MTHVIGTAGHVDHGKSALVQALTGINPDRLKEEQEREMTIDLGFAWLTLPSGEQVGIVDVPGHKDFIKNMLAGVGGIDAALFVVAADEGVMPQTREHLAILDLLQVSGGVVAVTKIDLIEDEEWLELVMADLAEQLSGTCLEGAEMIPVSARTGEGLSELVAALDRYLTTSTPRPDLGRPRLPIDRAFTISGFGTVVTGTLIDGTLQVGQEVEILPQGLMARIRGLQTHRQKIDVAVPGSRVAVNLTGVSTDQLHRGDVVTRPGWLHPTTLVDVQLRYLPDNAHPLKHNSYVNFFSGAAEVGARVRLLGVETLQPGETGWAQLRLESPVPLVRRDRFIIRQFSPSRTLGGGMIVEPHPGRRYRRFRPEVIARLEVLAHGTPEEMLLQTLATQQPCTARELIQRCGLPGEVATETLQNLLQSRQVLILNADSALEVTNLADSSLYLMTASGWQGLLERLRGVLRAFHALYPLRRGMSREELKSRLKMTGKVFNLVLSLAAAEGQIVEEGEAVRLSEHEVRFTAEQQKKVDALFTSFRRHPYTTPSYAECEASVGPEVLTALIEQGRLVKISDDVLYLPETYREMVERVIAHLKSEGTITVGQVRDMFTASRKYALALMTHLDELRITRRVGDERVLRPGFESRLPW